jgi:hypothetical protein
VINRNELLIRYLALSVPEHALAESGVEYAIAEGVTGQEYERAKSQSRPVEEFRVSDESWAVAKYLSGRAMPAKGY